MEKLKRAVRKWKKKKSPNDQLNLDDVQLPKDFINYLPRNVRNLSVRNTGISKIDIPPNVCFLDCGENTIMELKVTENLKSLVVDSNKLLSIDAKNLIHLDCSNNSGIQFPDKLDVEVFVAKSCGLVKAPILPRARIISVEHNSLSKINVGYNTEELYISYNNLVSIKISDNLKILACGYNKLKKLEINSKLVSLNAKNNELTTVKLNNVLESLDLSNNNLELFPSIGRKIKKIMVYNNKLRTIPELPNSVVYFNAGRNNLEKITNIPKNLERLVVFNNKLKKIPRLNDNLKVINIVKNDLKHLPKLPESLKVLLCKNNELKALPKLPKSINRLVCSYNNISMIRKLPKNLKHLDCSNNKLKALPQKFPMYIRVIDCSNNILVKLPEIYIENESPKYVQYFNYQGNYIYESILDKYFNKTGVFVVEDNMFNNTHAFVNYIRDIIYTHGLNSVPYVKNIEIDARKKLNYDNYARLIQCRWRYIKMVEEHQKLMHEMYKPFGIGYYMILHHFEINNKINREKKVDME